MPYEFTVKEKGKKKEIFVKPTKSHAEKLRQILMVQVDIEENFPDKKHGKSRYAISKIRKVS